MEQQVWSMQLARQSTLRPRVAGLSPHSAFQEHAAHVVEWSTTLHSKGSWGTCRPQGVTTFLLRAFTAHRLNKQRLINSLEKEVDESTYAATHSLDTLPYKISRILRGSLTQGGSYTPVATLSLPTGMSNQNYTMAVSGNATRVSVGKALWCRLRIDIAGGGRNLTCGSWLTRPTLLPGLGYRPAWDILALA